MTRDLIITGQHMEAYRAYLQQQERAKGTVEQYLRAVANLRACLRGRSVEATGLQEWKTEIVSRYRTATANAMIAAVNGFLAFCGCPELKLKSLRCQQRLFREMELTEEDYYALFEQAKKEGDVQMAVLLRSLCCTGVRVSEVRFLTVESAKRGMAVIRMKGKVRQIPLGRELCRELLLFAHRERITAGPIFRTRQGRALDRRRIWERLKALCPGAGVDPQRVHPHALRHLFARMFYAMTRDIVKLADILGHSSVNTTRIYTATSPQEHRYLMDRLTLAIDKKTPADRLPCTGRQNLHFVRQWTK